MPKKTTKAEAKKKPPAKAKSPAAKSKADALIDEPIIQDRIAGLAVGDLATKYGRSRQNIWQILKPHEERIKAERQEYLDYRQEKIDAALEKDVENLAALITTTTYLMIKAADDVKELMDQPNKKRRHVLETAEIALKLFDKVHSTVLAQQKEASKG